VKSVISRGLNCMAVCASIWAALLALSAMPEADRNPASTDIAWLRNEWLVAFVIANFLDVVAILLASWKGKALVAALLVLCWGVSAVPACQYYLYQLR
jgi:hypothetical protein